MASRLELQTKLEELLGSRNVYYNPPESVTMNYPAIVYSRKKPNLLHANNRIYKQFKCYGLTLIDENPDSENIEKVTQLPYCYLDGCFTHDNLNHYEFTLYF